MPRQFGDQADLDALGLQRGYEAVARAVRRDRREAEPLEHGHPHPLAKIAVAQRPAATDPWQRPRLHLAGNAVRYGRFTLKRSW